MHVARLTMRCIMCISVSQNSRAMSDQAAPAEPVSAGQHNRVVQNPEADCTLIILQNFCRLLVLAQLLQINHHTILTVA